MAYKPKNKQKQEVKEEIIDVLTNKTKTIKGKVFVDGQKLPDPKLHQLVSFIKSGINPPLGTPYIFLNFKPDSFIWYINLKINESISTQSI